MPTSPSSSPPPSPPHRPRWRVPAAAAAPADYVPGEVVVRYAKDADRGAARAGAAPDRRRRAEGVRAPHARDEDPRRPVGRARRVRRAPRPARGRHRRAEPDRARQRLRPAGPRQRRRAGRLAAAAVELRRPDERQRAGRLAAADRRAPPRRAGRRRRRARHRRRLQQQRPLPRPRRERLPRRARVACRRSPDFRDGDFVRGYDFVDDDSRPNDENGHGTHVACTIGEGTGDNVGVTGLAYGARIMPVRVLDGLGEGDSVGISAGIRYAARRGADVINLSFEFGTQVTRAARSRTSSPRCATPAARARSSSAPPATAPPTASPTRRAPPTSLSVGATTQHGCVAEYSNNGANLDLVAPGGGEDAAVAGDPNCRPSEPPGGNIFQMTFDGSPRRFGLPGEYMGTSMAAPHVSAAAALVIASGIIGPNPSPGRRRGAPEGHGARPRAGRAGLALRIRAARRRPRRLRPRLGADDQHAAGRVVGDLVRHGAEQEPLRARHALVADHDQVGARAPPPRRGSRPPGRPRGRRRSRDTPAASMASAACAASRRRPRAG